MTTLQLEDDKMRHLMHELRTPLNAIQNLTKLLIDSKTSKISADDMHTLHIILQASEIATSMATVRTDATSTLFDVVNGVFNIMIPVAETKNIRIQSRRSEMVAMKQLTINCIEPVRHALTNLLNNSIRFAKSRIYVTYANHVISVQDDGLGIPIQKRARLFVFGERLETTDGNGIGLALCLDMMKKVGGNISLRDGPSTIFDIHLP